MKPTNMSNSILTLLAIGGTFQLANHIQAAIWDTTGYASSSGNVGLVNSGFGEAQSFFVPYTDSDHNAWLFNSISLKFDSGGYVGDVGGVLSVQIWYDSGNVPDITQTTYSFTTASSYAAIAAGGTFQFTPLVTTRLSTGQYWVVVRDVGGDTTSHVGWTGSSADHPATILTSGIGDDTTYSSQGVSPYGVANWGSSAANAIPLQMSIEATVVPEPATFGLIGGLGLLGFAGWRRYSRK